MSKPPSFFLPIVAMFMGAVLVISSTSCRKRRPPVPLPSQVELPAEMQRNTLAGLPGPVYQSQVASPIHWQSWSAETLAMAKKSNRLVLGVIVTPQQPDYQKVLAVLSSDPMVVKTINKDLIPILIDGDASREMGLLTGVLCNEVNKSPQLPLFVWMSPEGDPVSWWPAGATAEKNLSSVFMDGHNVMQTMWKNDSSYVIKHFTAQQEQRKERIGRLKNDSTMSTDPGRDSEAALRQMLTLYDVGSRSLDEVGGLFPAGTLDLLASASTLSGLSPEVRRKSQETTRYLLQDLLPTAMFDPLDGGVFSLRYRSYSSLPVFERDTVTQGRVSLALFRAYGVTGNPLALERGLGCISFAEKSYSTTDGLFSSGMVKVTSPSDWLWKMDQLVETLGPDDAAWWAKLTGMKSMGNIPPEVDTEGNFFRMNSMALSKSIADLAAEERLSEAEFRNKFDKIRRQLLASRNGRLGVSVKDDQAHASASFRMVSAYAAAYVATGDAQFREKAVLLLTRARSAFASGPRLRIYAGDYPPSIADGRAIHYCLAMQAALDVADITLDASWLEWCDQLSATFSELFTKEDFLRECPREAAIMDLPITDLLMLFDDSTAGLASSVECRLAARGRTLDPTFTTRVTPFPMSAVKSPILHTDIIQAELARDFSPLIILGGDLPADLADAVSRLPLRVINRRPASSEDGVASGTVKIVPKEGDAVRISSAAGLREAFLPLR